MKSDLAQRLRSVGCSHVLSWTPNSGLDRFSARSIGKIFHLGRPKAPPRGGRLNPNDTISQIETILFLSRQPQTSRKLAQLAGLADGTKARTLVRTLNQRYDSEGRSFRVEEVAGGFQLMTRPKFAPWLRRLQPSGNDVRLSAPALETLAVVAYRQPVLRVEVEAIRGVQSGEVLRQLIERDLVRIVGRSSELGRPFLYGTTKQFLQVFGLRYLEELPRADQLRIPHSSAACQRGTPTAGDTITSNQPNNSPVTEEEETVKTLIANPKTEVSASGRQAKADAARFNDRIVARYEDDDEDDFDDDEDDEEEGEEEEVDEDLEDEPWEEVDDEDEDEEDLEDEDWDEDEDEDWEDEDWDEEEDDEEDEWDEDEDESEDEE